MKKIVSIIAAAALLLGVTSCANNAGDSNGSTNDNSTGTALSFTSLSFADVSQATTAGVTDEATAKTNSGKIGLWYDGNWCGSTVVPSNITGTADSLSFDYTVTGACTFGVQLFEALSTDGTYLVSYKVKSAVAQDVTCNGTTYSLQAGVAKEVNALVTVSGTTTVISVQVPVDATNIGASNSFEISEAKYAAAAKSDFTISALTLSSSAKSLSAGDKTTLTATGTYTLTDTSSHVYTIYSTVAASDITWSSSAEACASVSAGEITAVAAGSATITAKVGTAEAACAVTVAAAKDYGKYFSMTDSDNGSDAAVAAPGYMCLWADNNWCGSLVSLSAVSASATEYSLTRSVTGTVWYGTQIFCAETAGTYTVSFKVKSSAAGDITVNSTVYTLAADTEQTISYTKTLSTTGTVIAIQLGKESSATQLGDGTFTISDLSVTQ